MTHSPDTHDHATHDHATRAHDTWDACTATDVLITSHDVTDDGRIALHVLGPTRGVPAALWTDDPERLRGLLRQYEGLAQWQPRWNLLRLRCETLGTTVVCVAPLASGV
ncbi:hypothetical protein ABZ953_26520 [Streptomyces sp. NPDC046465]|uniref:hypothetical protein n=1 Tax=Streptomyces sp. NPDC046465 TaxID=3155810 RepID=UPI0033EC30AC